MARGERVDARHRRVLEHRRDDRGEHVEVRVGRRAGARAGSPPSPRRAARARRGRARRSAAAPAPKTVSSGTVRFVSRCTERPQNGWKAPGRNLTPTTRPRPVDPLAVARGADAVHAGGAGLDREVDRRVVEQLLRVGLVQVPLDHPVALDPGREVRGRQLAGQREVAPALVRAQDPPRAGRLGHVSHSSKKPRPDRPSVTAMTQVKPIPEGFGTVTPNLVVADGAAAIEFYERAFGAEVVTRLEAGGMLVHAALRIGGAMVTLCDAMPAHGMVAPDARGPGRSRSSRSTSRTPTRCTRRRWPPARPRSTRWPTSARRPRGLGPRPVRAPLGDRDARPRRARGGARQAAGGAWDEDRRDVRDHPLGRGALRRAAPRARRRAGSSSARPTPGRSRASRSPSC